jgi:hypothetical protein
VSKGRFIFLLGVLLFLAVCHLVVSVSQSPPPSRLVPLFTEDEFYAFIEGASIAPPDGGSLVIHRDRIESLRIEPVSEGDQVTFELGSDDGRYFVEGYISLHNTEGHYYPIVNLGRGWDISKQ